MIDKISAERLTSYLCFAIQNVKKMSSPVMTGSVSCYLSLMKKYVMDMRIVRTEVTKNTVHVSLTLYFYTYFLLLTFNVS